MGMQGFYGRPGWRRRAVVRGHRAPLHAATFSFFLLAALAGCSSNSSWSGSSQSVAVAPPPNQPTYSSAAQSPPPQVTPSGYEAPEGLPYPQQTLFDGFKGNATNASARPLAPSAAGTQITTESAEASSLPYPRQTLFSAFQGSGSAQAPNVPHPPSTYTASGQPYVLPQGQPTYSSPPPQSAQRPPSNYTASGQPYSPPGQPAARPPKGSAPQAAADDDEQAVPGYPARSISDIFH